MAQQEHNVAVSQNLHRAMRFAREAVAARETQRKSRERLGDAALYSALVPLWYAAMAGAWKFGWWGPAAEVTVLMGVVTGLLLLIGAIHPSTYIPNPALLGKHDYELPESLKPIYWILLVLGAPAMATIQFLRIVCTAWCDTPLEQGVDGFDSEQCMREVLADPRTSRLAELARQITAYERLSERAERTAALAACEGETGRPLTKTETLLCQEATEARVRILTWVAEAELLMVDGPLGEPRVLASDDVLGATDASVASEEGHRENDLRLAAAREVAHVTTN